MGSERRNRVYVFSNDDIEKILTMPACMEVLEELYRDIAEGKALLIPRVDNLLPAIPDDAYYGFKYMGGGWPRYRMVALRINSDIIAHPRIAGRKRRVKIPLADGRWVGLVQLYSIETGALLAIFPDGVAQRMRVGATNGLGIKYLSRENSERAGLIGSGWQAGAQLMALLEARPIKNVKVFSPSRKNREAFVAEMGKKTDANIVAVASLEQCVKDVDILMSATSSIDRVIDPAWLKPGMHVSCIKSQEVDESVFEACDRVVMHSNAQAKQADNVLDGTQNIPSQHLDGWWKRKSGDAMKTPDLADLASARVPGRTSDDAITCFVNNIGLGLQFVAVGALILDKAKSMKIGRELPEAWFTESVHP
jgi:ornithine cyclodeaminase/alanine dehydrogenase-like protein (mu-crystallin family)